METSGQAVPRQIGWGSNSWQKREKYKTNKKDKASNIPSMNQHSCLHLRTKRSPSLQGLLHFQTNSINLPLKRIMTINSIKIFLKVVFYQQESMRHDVTIVLICILEPQHNMIELPARLFLLPSFFVPRGT